MCMHVICDDILGSIILLTKLTMSHLALLCSFLIQIVGVISKEFRNVFLDNTNTEKEMIHTITDL